MAIVRVTRRNLYPDILRNYRILIDGVYRGNIGRHEITEYEVCNGNHTVCAKIDWCGSNEIDISVNDSVAEVEVGSSLMGWRFFLMFIYITFLSNQYLWIKHTS